MLGGVQGQAVHLKPLRRVPEADSPTLCSPQLIIDTPTSPVTSGLPLFFVIMVTAIKQVSFALPWIVMCVFQGIVYNKHDRRDGIAQREMFWEVLMVTAFVYLLLLPYLKNVSEEMYAAALEMGADIPQTDGKVDETFLMIFHEWFIRMAVPLGVLLIFHSTRARREELHPETEAEEPMMTKAEYDALRANEVDADASNDVDEITANHVALEAQTECPCGATEENEGTEVIDHE